MSSIAIEDLQEAGYNEITFKKKQNRFLIRGQKMYTGRLSDLVDIFTKDELKTFYKIVDEPTNFTKANILKKKFKDITPNMKTVARSRFKKKMIDNDIIKIYRNKIFFNPMILLPRTDKNIHNFQHLVQRSWINLFENKDVGFEGLDDFIDYIFE